MPSKYIEIQSFVYMLAKHIFVFCFCLFIHFKLFIVIYISAAYKPHYACKLPSSHSCVSLDDNLSVNSSTVQLVPNSCGISVVYNVTNGSSQITRTSLPCENGYNYDINQETIIIEVKCLL